MLSRNVLIRVVFTTATIGIVLLGLFLLILTFVEAGWRSSILAFTIVFPLDVLVIWLNFMAYRWFAVPLGDAEERRKAMFTAAACLCFLTGFYAVFADEAFDHLYTELSIGPTDTAGITAPLATTTAWGFLVVAVGLASWGLTGRHRTGRWEMVVSALFLYPPIGMAFAALYKTIPHSFPTSVGEDRSSLDYVFFSFTTLSTTGYGDLAVTGEMAKMLALVEQFTGGYVLLGLLVAGAMGLPTTGSRRPPRDQSTTPSAGVIRPDDV